MDHLSNYQISRTTKSADGTYSGEPQSQTKIYICLAFNFYIETLSLYHTLCVAYLFASYTYDIRFRVRTFRSIHAKNTTLPLIGMIVGMK